MKVKTGILLINLGTPQKEDVRSVASFLRKFLDDPDVIDLPWIIRKLLLYFFILPFRVSKTAKAYAAIWDKKRGSPLLVHSLGLASKLQAALGSQYQVELGMRYSNPSIPQALANLTSCQKIIALPLFPQYAQATTGSAIKVLRKAYKAHPTKPLWIKDKFFNDEHFILAQAKLIQTYLNNKDAHVIFSYHSLPVRQVLKSNQSCQNDCFENVPCPAIQEGNYLCYRAQCYETSRLIAQALELSTVQYTVVFQSQVGKAKWIGPEIQVTLSKLITQGIKDLIVTCPSFVTDCLETLEEVGLRTQANWQRLGGRKLILVPSLNDSSLWIEALVNWITQSKESFMLVTQKS